MADAATVLYDGSGLPTSAGYTQFGDPGQWTADTPAPGFLQQTSTNPAASAWQYGTSTILDRSTGWFWEGRLRTLSSNPSTFGYFAISTQLTDDLGGFGLQFRTDRVDVYNDGGQYQPGALVGSIFYSSGQFHTFRVELVGGQSTANFYVDDLVTPALSFTVGGPGNQSAFFGDVSNGATGTAEWDYVNFGSGAAPPAVPEPSSVLLVLFGLTGLGLRRRLRRA